MLEQLKESEKNSNLKIEELWNNFNEKSELEYQTVLAK